MLYLEDYLEMIEHLPQELRDRFTEMREMDLQVQNAMDNLDERVKLFFINARKHKQEQRDVEYEGIRQDYYKALEDADEKVQIANQIYDLVDRYLRRLDQELQKFKMELEADNAGITEILEKRSLELDNPPPLTNNIKAEKRKLSLQSSVTSAPPEKRIAATEKVLTTIPSETIKDVVVSRAGSSSASSHSSSSSTSSTLGGTTPDRAMANTPSFGYSLGAGSNAIAAAASQAIAATQQQGRRTASLKASYEAINSGLPSLSREFTLGSRDIGSLTSVTPAATTAAVAATPEPKATNRPKKQVARNIVQAADPPPGDDSEDSSVLDENGQSADWTYDPNEPRYCICNQVSYGDMVACDNEDCPFEWFHYACVGITQPPKGKWFCPQCISTMKRRGRKEK